MAIESKIEEVEIPEAEGSDLDPELLGGNMDVEPGDVVRIVVVSGINPETGTWRGKYAENDSKKPSAIDEMASTYKSPKDMMEV